MILMIRVESSRTGVVQVIEYVCVGVCWVFLLLSLLSFALSVSGLEDTGSGHEVLNVLTQNLVLRLQFQVLLFDSIHSGREV